MKPEDNGAGRNKYWVVCPKCLVAWPPNDVAVDNVHFEGDADDGYWVECRSELVQLEQVDVPTGEGQRRCVCGHTVWCVCDYSGYGAAPPPRGAARENSDVGAAEGADLDYEPYGVRDMPPDLLAALRDPSTVLPQDATVYELVAKWVSAAGLLKLRLCDEDGVVREGRPFFEGIDYPCTGNAHYDGVELRCDNPRHAPKAAGPLAEAPEEAEAISKDVQQPVRDVTGEGER